MTDSKETAQGRPWTIVGTYSTYEEAAARVESELAVRLQAIKVKRTSDGYTVRTRKPEKAAPSSASASAPEDSSKKSRVKAKDRRNGRHRDEESAGGGD